MAIEGGGAQPLDRDVREIAVRELKGPVAIGTPEVLRARTAVELRAIEDDPRAVPVASRRFSRRETLLIRFAAYAPGDDIRAGARLLSRFGQAIRTLTVGRVGDDHQIVLPLAPFAPGDYVIEVSATSPAGGAKELVNFHVAG
jgi:hypothetical protein